MTTRSRSIRSQGHFSEKKKKKKKKPKKFNHIKILSWEKGENQKFLLVVSIFPIFIFLSPQKNGPTHPMVIFKKKLKKKKKKKA